MAVKDRLVRGLVGLSVVTSVLVALPTAASAGPVKGQLYAWGENDFYQLGNGGTTNQKTPKPIQGMSNVIGVAGGIAVKSDGSVWTWGDNSDGELGNGSHSLTAPGVRPARVGGLSSIVAVASFAQTRYALSSNGEVYAWGSNAYEELGNGTTVESDSPSLVPGVKNVTQIVAGEGFAHVLKSNGTVWGWGMFVAFPIWSFWPPQTPGSAVAEQLAFPPNVTSIGAGPLNSYAVVNGARGWSMGFGEYGALGNHQLADTAGQSVEITKLSGLRTVTADSYAAFGLTNTGHVWSWGSNGSGDLGTGVPLSTTVLIPREIASLHGITQVASSSDGAMALFGPQDHGLGVERAGAAGQRDARELDHPRAGARAGQRRGGRRKRSQQLRDRELTPKHNWPTRTVLAGYSRLLAQYSKLLLRSRHVHAYCSHPRRVRRSSCPDYRRFPRYRRRHRPATD